MGGKANPYGRLLSLMGSAGKAAVGKEAGFLIGEMITGATLKVGDLKLARDDYLMLTNEININGRTLKLPFKREQSVTVTISSGNNLIIKVPPLKKGDKVLCYQISDEEFVVFGKVE